MDRMEKIRCGAYVYFSFLRPFAEVAGVADELDWTVPRDLPEPVVEFLSLSGRRQRPAARRGAYYEEYADASRRRAAARQRRPGRRAPPRAGATSRSGASRGTSTSSPATGRSAGGSASASTRTSARCLVPRRRVRPRPPDRRRGRPRGAVPGGRPSRSAATACGPSTSAPPARALAGRQRGLRASPSTNRPSCTGPAAPAATGCRWASTSSGRPTASRTTTPGPPATRSRAGARRGAARRRAHRDRRPRPARPLVGACGTGGSSAGCGRRGGSTTAPASTAPTSATPTPELGFGYLQPPGGGRRAGGLARSPRRHRPRRRGARTGGLHRLAASARSPASTSASSPLAFAPVLLTGPRARSPLPRAMCRFTADGRTGFGWTEWNQPQLMRALRASRLRRAGLGAPGAARAQR